MNLTSAFSNQPNMSDDEYRLLRNLVYDESGIWLKDEKKSFLTNRAFKRMREKNISSFYRYYKYLTDLNGGKSELLAFLDALTINETSFFRNRPQMDLFADIVLREIIARKRAEGRFSLRIWSAACSTGQEPYTIGMILREAVHDIDKWNVRITASDLSLTVLEAAQKGVYPAEKMDSVPQAYTDRHFIKEDGGFRIADEIKRLVVFDFHNLMHENGARDFDVIFCRNVLIYFDDPTQKKVIDRFTRALVPGGYLFLGHSESLQGKNDGFEFIHHNKGTAYRKKT